MSEGKPAFSLCARTVIDHTPSSGSSFSCNQRTTGR
jgi:hypothetical protein